MDIKFSILLQQNITLILTSPYMVHTSQKTFSENLHFISQSVFLQSLLVMWTLQPCDGVYYLTRHVILKGWVNMVEFILLSYQRGFPNSGLTTLDIPTVSHSLHIVVHIWYKTLTQDHKNLISDNFLFTTGSIFLPGNILDANNKKGNSCIHVREKN
jgi:hypothetical protein